MNFLIEKLVKPKPKPSLDGHFEAAQRTLCERNERVLKVLRSHHAQNGLTAAEIANELGIHKLEVHSSFQNLRKNGFTVSKFSCERNYYYVLEEV